MSLFFLLTNKNVEPRLCDQWTPTVLKGNIFQAGYFNSLRFYENSDEYGCVKFTFALSRKPRAWLYHHETTSALRCGKINFLNAPSTNVWNAALFSPEFYLAGILNRVHSDIYTTWFLFQSVHRRDPMSKHTRIAVESIKADIDRKHCERDSTRAKVHVIGTEWDSMVVVRKLINPFFCTVIILRRYGFPCLTRGS